MYMDIYIFTMDYFYSEIVVPRSGEVKDGQWLGVSVESQGTEEGKAVVSYVKNNSGLSNKNLEW